MPDAEEAVELEDEVVYGGWMIGRYPLGSILGEGLGSEDGLCSPRGLQDNPGCRWWLATCW